MAANSKKFVVDASFILCFLLSEEDLLDVEEKIDQFRDQKITFVSVPLLNYEVQNGLKMSVVRHRVSAEKANELCDTFFKLNIPFGEISQHQCFNLALKHDLTFYDACYLQLANVFEIPLLTLDKKLAKLSA